MDKTPFKKQLKNRIEITFIRFFGALPLPLSRLFARFISFSLWISNSKAKRTTEVNIKLCFPKLSKIEQLKLSKKSLLESVRTGLEIPIAWLEPADRSLNRLRNISGNQLITSATSQGRGVIIVLPHLGNWEFLSHYIGKEFKCTSLFKPPRNELLLSVMQEGRSSTGGILVPTNKKGVSALLKALKSAGVICILPDQIPDEESGYEFADFYGQPAATMTLVSKLLSRTNSIAVSCFVKRVENGKFDVIFQSAPEQLYSNDIEQSVIGLNKMIEQLVNIAPEQYQWEYKRFRKGPEGRRDIY